MGYKLLLADDSITIQKVVSIIFANEECELSIVDNGDAALEKAAEIVPDIMLVDTLMPGTSGYEVCEKVRRNPSLKNIPLLLLSGAFEPFDVDKARESGADDFISKPFESQQLVDKVKNLVELGLTRTAAAPPSEPAAPAAAPEDNVWESEATTVMAGKDSFAGESAPLPAAEGDSPSDEGIWGEAPAEWPLPESPELQQDSDPGMTEEVQETVWSIDMDAVDTAGEAFPKEESEGGEAVPAEPDVVETMVEASPDDDLWGAFELEPVEDDGLGVVETYAVDPIAELGEVAPLSQDAGNVSGNGAGWEQGEQIFSPGSEEEAAPAVEETFSAPPESTEEVFTFSVQDAAFAPEPAGEEEELSSASGGAPSVPLTASPVDGGSASTFDDAFFFQETDIPPVSAEAQAAPAPEAAEPVYAPVVETYAPVESPSTSGNAQIDLGEGSGVSITEDKMVEMISRISKEMIERIVWEVVPDLAESLIKEEIRKIKEGR